MFARIKRIAAIAVLILLALGAASCAPEIINNHYGDALPDALPDVGNIFVAHGVEQAMRNPEYEDCLLDLVISVNYGESPKVTDEVERIEAEAARLKELGCKVEVVYYNDGNAARLHALLTPEQLSKYPYDRNAGYMIYFVKPAPEEAE